MEETKVRLSGFWEYNRGLFKPATIRRVRSSGGDLHGAIHRNGGGTVRHPQSRRNLEMYVIPGDRYEMMRSPHVRVLASQLEACLNGVGSYYDEPTTNF